MAGAPSQLDLFDDKPTLKRFDGKPVPAEVVKGQRYAFIRPDANLMASRFAFARHGQSGADLSEMLPHLAKVVDDIAIVKSVHTDQFNHAPAQIFVNTGSSLPGRPCMGSWVTYGLGSEAADLPGFVVLSSGSGISGGAANWSSGFLPTAYQGVTFRSQGQPDPQRQQPRRLRRPPPARLDRPDPRPQRKTPRRGRRPRDRHPRRLVRDGLSDAVERP